VSAAVTADLAEGREEQRTTSAVGDAIVARLAQN
jgi:hypothetical protein